MQSLTLASVQPACTFGDELAKWFNAGADLAARGVDCFDLDLFVHDRAVVPDTRAALTVLNGYYAAKHANPAF